VIRISRETRLLLPNALQVPPGGLGSTGLEQATDTPDTAAHGLDRFARILIAFAVRGEFNDAEVNTQAAEHEAAGSAATPQVEPPDEHSPD
jgi:hypothetical protein